MNLISPEGIRACLLIGQKAEEERIQKMREKQVEAACDELRNAWLALKTSNQRMREIQQELDVLTRGRKAA